MRMCPWLFGQLALRFNWNHSLRLYKLETLLCLLDIIVVLVLYLLRTLTIVLTSVNVVLFSRRPYIALRVAAFITVSVETWYVVLTVSKTLNAHVTLILNRLHILVAHLVLEAGRELTLFESEHHTVPHDWGITLGSRPHRLMLRLLLLRQDLYQMVVSWESTSTFRSTLIFDGECCRLISYDWGHLVLFLLPILDLNDPLLEPLRRAHRIIRVIFLLSEWVDDCHVSLPCFIR